MARTEFPIDFDQGLLRRLDRILPKRLAQHNTDVVALRKEHMDLRYPCIDDRANDVLCEFIIRLDDHFAGVRVHDVADSKCTLEVFRIDFEPLYLRLLNVVINGCRDLLSGMDQHFFRLRVRNVLRYLETDNVVGDIPKDLLTFDRQTIGLVEGANDFLVTLQTEGT